jgi:hypothetical protein
MEQFIKTSGSVLVRKPKGYLEIMPIYTRKEKDYIKTKQGFVLLIKYANGDYFLTNSTGYTIIEMEPGNE